MPKRQTAIKLEYSSPCSERMGPERQVRSSLWWCLAGVVLFALFTFAVPYKWTNRTGEAKTAAARTDVSNLRDALAAFRTDMGRLPTTAEGLNALIVKPADGADRWHGPYVMRLPHNDPWGMPYVYRQPGSTPGSAFDLLSFGPDKEPGGGDDINE